MRRFHAAKPKRQPRAMRQRVVMLLELFAVLFLATSFYQTWRRNQAAHQQIDLLSTKLQQTEHDTTDLQQFIEYLNSSAYIEEKARADLGLQKPGEHVAIVQGHEVSPMHTTTTSVTPTPPVETIATPVHQWRRYFFGS